MADRQFHCSRCFVRLAAALILALPSCALAQPHRAGPVELRFDRFYNYEEMTQALKDLAAGYPEFLKLESIGKSSEGRDMWMMTVNNAKTGSDRDKPAMYIDAVGFLPVRDEDDVLGLSNQWDRPSGLTLGRM